MTEPSIEDVLLARRVLARHLRPTPLYRWPLLERGLGLELLVKHENHQPIGAFKVRGGLYLMSRLSDDERRRGVITASTGNHGQSIAYAARAFGVRAIVVVPEGANPGKVATMEALGAEVRFHGRQFDDAREHVESLAASEGYRYVHSANEPDLIAGVATCALEILEEAPALDALIVPIGGGSGAAGAAIVARALRPSLEVVGSQSEQAPAAWRSWKEKRLVEAPCATFAEGVATRTAFALTQEILRAKLDDFVLVPDEEIRAAMRLFLETTRNLVEGAGAIPLAAARRLAPRLAGKRVAVVASGGNASIEELRRALDA